MKNPFSRFFRARDKPGATDSVSSASTFYFGSSAAGKSVTASTAIQMSTVYACVRVIAETIASLPLHVYQNQGEGSVKALDHPLYPILHDEPNSEMTSFVWRETMLVHLLLWGNTYCRIIRSGRNQILGLYPLLPDRMEVDRDSAGMLTYTYSANGGQTVKLRSEDVLHIPGLGFVRNALQVGTLSEGGYTVPDEFEHQLIQGLEDENIMRGLVHNITTSSGDRKIPLVTARGSASWVEEEAAIPESDGTFGQVTLGAHKVGCMIRVSEELLHDSAFDLAAYIAGEFARRVGAAEEEAILTGSGTHKPTGLLHDSLGAELGVTAASAVAITADELIDLQHSVKSGYRRKGLWIMNDATLKLLRKLKDGQGNFIWQLGLLAGQPDTLLNQKVMISNCMPLPAAGSKAILYGDLSYYWLADREGRTLQRLDELYAAQDQVGFKITQRVDGRLLLRESVKCLQMKAA